MPPGNPATSWEKKGVANGGGRPRATTYQKSPSSLPSVRHTRKPAGPRGSKNTKKSNTARRSLEHRWCFRCRRRQDHCREEGCEPFTYILPQKNLTDFLQTFDATAAPMRRTSDCWDVQIMQRWAVAAKKAYGMRTALLGMIVGAHFKSLRTWDAINKAFRQDIDWNDLRLGLARCGELWGVKGSPAVYSGSNMTGSGLMPFGENYLDRFPFWFQQVSIHSAFAQACALLEAGITSFALAELLELNLQKMRRDIKGLLGDYHFKMLYDYLVASKFLPPRWVCKYPVCSDGGTARGLRDMYSITGEGSGPKSYAEMLNEFTFQVREQSTTWWWTDHLGSVGAALCWLHRKETASTSKHHSNRLEQTSSAQWDRELAQLQEHGFFIFGYHKGIP